MPDYKTNDPRGWCGDPSRGAALGRCDRHNAPNDFAGELTLREIHIDKGGYDDNGTYWGTGDPLFWYASEDGAVDACLRAKNREDAMRKVREHYGQATFAAPEAIDPAFFSAYVECALWSSTDHNDNDRPLDDEHSEADIAPETLAEMRADCEKFQRDCAKLLARAYGSCKSYSPERAGHDFWLTRCGHGAGFWDRNLGDVGDALTNACKKWPEVYLEVGDDGKIHSD